MSVSRSNGAFFILEVNQIKTILVSDLPALSW